MTIFFSRLRIGYPEPLKEPEDTAESWRVYTVCSSLRRGSCTTRKDVRELGVEDQKKARKAFIALINRAKTGQPLSELYDKKRCHEAFEINFNGKPIKIFRLRTADVRIYFCYLPNKVIVLLKTLSKREDDLSDGEKTEIENIARSVLQYAEPNLFTQRVI